jgi:hypothetical protein
MLRFEGSGTPKIFELWGLHGSYFLVIAIYFSKLLTP